MGEVTTGATLELVLKARDDASAVINGMGATFEANRKKIGIAMTAAGAAITGVAVLAIKSSQEQAIGISLLDKALERVGTSYGNEKTAIEASISALMAKTNFSDEAQRQSLTRLVTLTGDYQQSLAALPTVIDMAAALQMDLDTASLLVSKALEGNTSALTRYGITLEEGATATEIMAALTEKFGGSAAAAADPLVQLQNQLGELLQVVGDVLIPTLNTVLPIITDVVRTVGAWAEAHPGLTKVLVLGAVAVGGLLLVLGPLLLMLPSLVAGFTLLTGAMSLAGGPVGVGLFLAAVTTLSVGLGLLLPKLLATNQALEDQIMTVEAGSPAFYELVKQRRELMIASEQTLPLLKDEKEATKALAASYDELMGSVEDATSALMEMDRLEEMLGLTNADFMDDASTLARLLGVDMATAMELLAEAAIPELQSRVNALVQSFVDYGDTVEQTEAQVVAAILRETQAIEDNLQHVRDAADEQWRLAQQAAARKGQLEEEAFAATNALVARRAMMEGAEQELGQYVVTGRQLVLTIQRMFEERGIPQETMSLLQFGGGGPKELMTREVAEKLIANLFTSKNLQRYYEAAGIKTGLPLMDTGGLVQGPGLFAVGPGVKEVVREGQAGGTITIDLRGSTIYGLDDMEMRVAEAVRRVWRRGGLGFLGT